MTKLKDNISSKYREAKNILNKPRVGLNLVEVYVENEDDKPFWKRIFNRHKIKTKIYPASRDTLRRGKQEVLKLKAGRHLILCVDSDYDFLLQESTEQSKLINRNLHIFQTYTYSIENYQCFAESLEEVVLQATLQDEPELFDYVAFLQDYSSIIYNLFIYSFHSEKNNSQADFSISDFCKTVKLQKVVVSEQGKQALEDLKIEIQNQITKLETISEVEVENYKSELEALGLTKDNVYLFTKGHIIYDNVVCIFLDSVANHLRKEHLNRIEIQAKNNKDINETKEEQTAREKKEKQIITDNKKEYRNSTVSVKQALKLNTNYHACFLMLKIDTDVEKYKNQYEKK